MNTDQGITLGEVHRLQLRQVAQLDRIESQVTKTNGTVGRHALRLSILEMLVYGATGLMLTAVIGAWLLSLLKGPA